MFKRTGGVVVLFAASLGQAIPPQISICLLPGAAGGSFPGRAAGIPAVAAIPASGNRAYLFEAETGTLFLLNYKDFQMT